MQERKEIFASKTYHGELDFVPASAAEFLRDAKYIT